ncbi:MAG: NAD(P)/FAD-dependent oxidoreductase [Fimbriimonas sp.]
MNTEVRWDVAIIGGGPAGSTAATMLKKYAPHLNVCIVEREKFPREHVGESQLPPISLVLDEMGVWDKVEAAGFPIKIGATYRWGSSDDLWDFEFLNGKQFQDEPRPAKFEGQRKETAFQVDRAIYDKILLDHAASLGTHVREETRVTEIQKDGDRITGLILDGNEKLEARYYLDATGNVGLMRRAMGVEVDCPTSLKNIAIWDYWENAEWAVKIGVGGTRVQVMSIGYGWLWFIPMGPTRTSLGLIVPAEHYKKTGMSPEEIYLDAISREPLITKLTENATREGVVRATKDWSFVSKRLVGENWFLTGEAAGFADPILAAGMTLAHIGAKECAYTILELERGEHDAEWLRHQYEDRQQKKIWQHIRFADYWYTHNTHFTDLQAHTADIARDAGIELDSKKAWQWLGTGGFIGDDLSIAGFAGFNLDSMHVLRQLLQDEREKWEIEKFNVIKLNLEGAEQKNIAHYAAGRIQRIPAWTRDKSMLPMTGTFRVVVTTLQRHSEIDAIMEHLEKTFVANPRFGSVPDAMRSAIQSLEALLMEGWAVGSFDESLPLLQPEGQRDLSFYKNTDNLQVAAL